LTWHKRSHRFSSARIRHGLDAAMFKLIFFPDWGIVDASPVSRTVHDRDIAGAFGAGGSGSPSAILVVTKEQEIENT
jgi:hypothetical protein